MGDRSELVAWLLDSDPALRWRVERDLVGAPPSVWAATRARIATEGYGGRLLALQDADGQWAGGAYFPAAHDFSSLEPPAPGEPSPQPWTATTWSLNALREWGLDASVLGDTAARLAANSRWEYDDLPYWGGEVDACINAWTLANGGWLGVDVSALAQWFVDHAMAEGGWNCEWVNGSTRASFHSTLNALTGILDYERRAAVTPELRVARQRAEEYLLRRHLVRRLSGDGPPGPWIGLFAYPFRWVYTALRALDYFRSAALVDGRPPDPRLADGVAVIRPARQPDGRWLQQYRFPGEAWFEVDVPPGEPSRWLTFYATRVIDWWDAAQPG